GPRSGAAGREWPLAGGGPSTSQTTQEHALEIAAAFQPGARTIPPPIGPTLARQAGDRAGLGAQRPLRTFLDLQILETRRRVSGLLDLARLAQPHRTDEKGGPDAAHP